MILETPQKRNKWKGRLQKIGQSAMLMAALSGAPKGTFAQNTATTTNLNSQTEMLTSPPQKVVRLQEKMEIPAGSPMHFLQENIHKIPQELQDHYHELMRLYEQEYQFVHISKIPVMNQYLEDIFRYIEDPVQRLRAGLIFLEAAPGDHNAEGKIVDDFLDRALEEEIITEEMLPLYIEPAIEEMWDWFFQNYFDVKTDVLRLFIENIAERKENIAERKENIAERKENIAERKENIAERKENIAERKENIAERKENIAETDERILDWFETTEQGVKNGTIRIESLLGIKDTVLRGASRLNLDLEKDYPLIWAAISRK